MSTDISGFLKPIHLRKQEYVPIDETPEEREAKSEAEKEGWREVYKFAHMQNRAGTKIDDALLIKLCELHYLNLDKVRTAFQRIYTLHEDAHGINDKPDIVKVEYFLNKKYEFARNEVTQRSECRLKNSNDDFGPINTDTIYRELQHVGFKFTIDRLKSLLRSNFMVAYNPFMDYFENLEPWDYETDYIGQLANYIEAEDQEFHVNQFRKMLVRSVGCTLYGVENRFVYVFVSQAQEVGKSSFIRFLNPFGTNYYCESPIRETKDTYFRFSENFIYNMEELSSLSNIGVNHLKAIISMTLIKERKPHAVDDVIMPRRANLWGSSNKEDGFLTDDINSRWLCIKLKSINWGYRKEVDIHKVWAQAYALWHDDRFNSALTAEEIQRREEINRNFEVTSIEKELIKQCFEVCGPEGTFYTNPDIMNELSLRYNGKPLDSRFIGKCFAQLGFQLDRKTVNGHRVRGYYAKLIQSPLFSTEPVVINVVPSDGNNEVPKLFD